MLFLDSFEIAQLFFTHLFIHLSSGFVSLLNQQGSKSLLYLSIIFKESNAGHMLFNVIK